MQNKTKKEIYLKELVSLHRLMGIQTESLRKCEFDDFTDSISFDELLIAIPSEMFEFFITFSVVRSLLSSESSSSN